MDKKKCLLFLLPLTFSASPKGLLIFDHTVPNVDLDLIIWLHLGPMGVKLGHSFVEDGLVAGERILSGQI